MSSLPSLQLAYRPDLEVLTARWFTDVPLATFQAEYAEVLAASRQHQARRWLLDVRRRPVPPVGAATWLVAEWLPRAVQALAPGRLRIAYLISPQRAQTMQTDEEVREATRTMQGTSSPYDMHAFNDEGEAVRWLLA